MKNKLVTAKAIKELRQRTGVGIVDCKKALVESNTIDEAIQWLKKKGISKGAAKASREALEGVIVVHQNKNIFTIIEVNCETDFVAKNKTFIKTAEKLAMMMQKKNITEPTKEEEEFMNLETFRIGEKISIKRVKHINVNYDNSLAGVYVHNGNRKGGIVVVAKPITNEIAEKVAMHVVAMNPMFIRRDQIPDDYIKQERRILKEQLMKEGKPENIIEKIVDGKLKKMYSEIVLEEQQYALSEKKKETILDLTKGSRILEMYRFEVGVK